MVVISRSRGAEARDKDEDAKMQAECGSKLRLFGILHIQIGNDGEKKRSSEMREISRSVRPNGFLGVWIALVPSKPKSSDTIKKSYREVDEPVL